MDIFERFLLAEQEAKQSESQIVNDWRPNKDQSSESLTHLSGLGGRKGFSVGDRFNLMRVVEAHVKRGPVGIYTNREYVVECLAPRPDGRICGKKGIAKYHQIYYQTLYSCGCTLRPKHPPIRLEGKRLGRIEVLRWTTDYDGMWELVCHECGALLYRKTVAQVRAAGGTCMSHEREVA